MTSILTNTSAMTAMAALTMTQDELAQTQNEISTGLKISSAQDNAAYWSIANKMTSQTSALGAVSDALNESSAMVSTMSTALNSTITIMTSIKNDLIAASSPGADIASIQTDIGLQQQALIQIGKSANFNGTNMLDTTASSVNIVSGYDATSGVSTISLSTANTQLFDTAATTATAGILGVAGTASGTSVLGMTLTSSSTSTDIANMLTDVETASQAISTAAATLGGTANMISTQTSFTQALSDQLTNGVGALVDADMNEASTRLAALQVQQQLGIQALAIANSNSQSVLKLFQ